MTAAAPPAFSHYGSAHGVYWLRRAYAMFRAAPLPWIGMVFVYYLIVAVAELRPLAWIGQFLAPALKPVFAVGFLAAAWTQERGGRPQLSLLFRGFRSNLYALVPLGIFFMTGVTLAIYATTLVDGGALIAMLSGTVQPSEEVWRSGRMQVAMLFGIVCALPTVMALWFAPALVVFDDADFFTALVTSARAALSNWRPLLVYALTVFGLGGVVPMVVISLLALVNQVLAGLVGLFVLAPYAVTLIVTLHISDYVSYRDVFHPDAATPERP